MSPSIKCAGQSCEQRKGCVRYEARKDPYDPDRWASFDIEAQVFGVCPHRINLKEAMQGAKT